MNEDVSWTFLGFYSGVAEVSNLLEHESVSLNNGIPCDPETIVVIFRLHINITIAEYCFIILLTFPQPYSYRTYYQTLSCYIKTALTKVLFYIIVCPPRK